MTADFLSPPPPEPLDSPLPEHVDLDAIQRQLRERFGQDVDIRRYVQLVTDPTSWDIPTIAEQLNVTRIAVDKWRARTKAEGPGGPVGLPEPDGFHGQSPWWSAGRIRRWAIEKGKMLPNGTPIKAKGTDRNRRKTR